VESYGIHTFAKVLDLRTHSHDNPCDPAQYQVEKNIQYTPSSCK